jgi:hypothetical protein
MPTYHSNSPENLPQEPEGPVQVRKVPSNYRHFVPGGRDSIGMPWKYQTTYCGAPAGKFGWHTPDSFGWKPDELPECPKCLDRMEKGRR